MSNTLTMLPTVGGPTAPAVNGTRPAGSTSGTSNAPADGGIGSTFLGLLAKELQNQDPTAPMDSTAMVGQMISLNSLDQLINISQLMQYMAAGGSGSGSKGGNTSASGATVSGVTGAAQTSAATKQAPTAASLAASQTAAANQAQAAYQLPFDPNTMMPVDPQHPTGTNNSVNSISSAQMNALGRN